MKKGIGLFVGLLCATGNQVSGQACFTDTGDSLFKTLLFTPFQVDSSKQLLVEKMRAAGNGIENIRQVISNDPQLLQELDRYMISLGNNSEKVTPADLLSFLASMGIGTDYDFSISGLSINKKTTVSYARAIALFPELAGLPFEDDHRDIEIYCVNGFSSSNLESQGVAAGSSIELFIDQIERLKTDRILFNELSGVIFGKFIRLLKQQRSDMMIDGHMYIPSNNPDSLLTKILGIAIPNEQRNEYRGDLSSIANNPKFFYHILEIALLEHAYTEIYSQLDSPLVGKEKGARYIHDTFPTYLLTIHTIGNYILSQDFLETIPCQEGGNLWNYYNKIFLAQINNQVNQIRNEKINGINGMAFGLITNDIGWKIAKDEQAMCHL